MTDPRTSTIAETAKQALLQRGLFQNTYFRALADGTLSLENFRQSQEQFLHAVRFFPRPLAALIARIPEGRDRLQIMRNLVEEHGDFDETQFHATTFQHFLGSIGSDPDALRRIPVGAPIRAFNSTLATACVLDHLEIGLACMGILELAFSTVSSLIGKAVVERGWVHQDQLVHYRHHTTIDHRHAQDLFILLAEQMESPRQRERIQQGLEMGAYAMDRLYRDLV